MVKTTIPLLLIFIVHAAAVGVCDAFVTPALLQHGVIVRLPVVPTDSYRRRGNSKHATRCIPHNVTPHKKEAGADDDGDSNLSDSSLPQEAPNKFWSFQNFWTKACLGVQGLRGFITKLLLAGLYTSFPACVAWLFFKIVTKEWPHDFFRRNLQNTPNPAVIFGVAASLAGVFAMYFSGEGTRRWEDKKYDKQVKREDEVYEKRYAKKVKREDEVYEKQFDKQVKREDEVYEKQYEDQVKRENEIYERQVKREDEREKQERLDAEKRQELARLKAEKRQQLAQELARLRTKRDEVLMLSLETKDAYCKKMLRILDKRVKEQERMMEEQNEEPVPSLGTIVEMWMPILWSRAKEEFQKWGRYNVTSG